VKQKNPKQSSRRKKNARMHML